eukprot:TRINITY_DN47050_c0_g1_i1.p1 TRINITY_DN47050_c0_g1~~TRINITY_DN47050_c0_g1_i1.p1  ORF type:complete len:113 (+),score=35.79 TRINITY_DN47050_c0_g1_i1:152-490(+)
MCIRDSSSAMLYFTGSDAHNIKMRQQAINMGLILCEYGLFKAVGASGDSLQKMGAGAVKGEMIPTFSEEEIFQVLKMPYLKPEPVSYTHLRAHETPEHLVCRLLLEKKKKKK